MIDLYTWTTPNGYKVSIALEELGLAYRALPVNIGRGEQFEPSFLAISPNNRIPAIVDHDGPRSADPGGAPLALFESGAILIYLAEKAGRLLPGSPGRVHSRSSSPARSSSTSRRRRGDSCLRPLQRATRRCSG